MTIKKIKISNFKSFKNLEIELGKFNVLIGANASGKSNFIQIFKFIRDITDHGLNNAISMQGGVEYLRNINIGSSENFSLEVVFDIITYEIVLRFVIEFEKRGTGFKIIEDIIILKDNTVKTRIHEKRDEEEEKLELGEITISNVEGKIDIDSSKLSKSLLEAKKIIDAFSMILERTKPKPETLLLELLSFPLSFFSGIYPGNIYISIYNFDPKLSKKAIPITGKVKMEEDGSNLAIVLKNIIEDEEKQRKFSNLIKYILPFVDDLDVEKFVVDKSLFFKLRETYAKEQYLPAFLISDGTINITALIIGLYFERNFLTIIEEPERNIHPYLISKVVEMMKDASNEKQIIVTTHSPEIVKHAGLENTHSPEIVKHAGLENILLISRDKDGFSVISKPHEKETVKTFLQNELGIEDLYVQNLLELEDEL